MKYVTRNEFGSLLIAMGMLAICLLASGCTNDVDSDQAVSEKLPKLYLHCPKSFPPSVERMREVYDSIFSSDALPKPITIRVVEIVHGEGAAAHSHYHLAEQKPDDPHLHEESADEKTHDVQIDVFTEFRDLAYKLPKVAADGDMQEADWLAVKNASEQLIETFDSVISESQSEEQMRTAVRTKESEFNGLLTQLEALLPVTDTTESTPQQDQ